MLVSCELLTMVTADEFTQNEGLTRVSLGPTT